MWILIANWLVDATVVIVAIVSFYFSSVFFKEIWRWLKGSRTSYFQQAPTTISLFWAAQGNRTEKKLRIGAERTLGFNPGVTIEINRGLFRRRSATCGGTAWSINKTWRDVCGIDFVSLKSDRGMIITDALRLINAYPSLSAMLDRIAELEKQLSRAEDRRQEWFAALEALRRIIEAERQRYRSAAAGTIRNYIESVQRTAKSEGEPNPSEKKVDCWVRSLPTLSPSSVRKARGRMIS